MKPLNLLIKPAAGLCNMRCGYCFYRAAAETRENRVMDEATADTLIQKIAADRPDALSVVFQGGEPTLAGLPFFRSFVKKLKNAVSCPIRFSLQTNGLLLDDAWAVFLKENGFLTGVSLDGNRRTNDRYRLDPAGESVLPRVLEAMNTLKKHGADFNVLAVVDDRNAADIETTWNYFKKHGLQYVQFIPLTDACGVRLSPEAYEAFLKKSFDLWYRDLAGGNYVSVRHIDNYVGMLLGRPPESCAMQGVCGGYYVIEANGDLYPCDFYCTPPYRLGSVFDEAPFAPGDTQRQFIEESKTIHESCESCRYYALCRGGCKNDRTEDFTKNKYCAAYRAFFDASIQRMERAAALFANGGTFGI